MIAYFSARIKSAIIKQTKFDHGCDKNLKIISAIDDLNKLLGKSCDINEIRELAKLVSREMSGRLNRELIASLKHVQISKKVPVGIISSGCWENIESGLAGYQFYPAYLAANKFAIKANGQVYFDFAIYTNKSFILKSWTREYGFSPDSLLFIGDDQEDLDCFAMVGFPVVMPTACDQVKCYLRKMVKDIFVPNNIDELINYLNERT